MNCEEGSEWGTLFPKAAWERYHEERGGPIDVTTAKVCDKTAPALAANEPEQERGARRLPAEPGRDLDVGTVEEADQRRIYWIRILDDQFTNIRAITSFDKSCLNR